MKRIVIDRLCLLLQPLKRAGLTKDGRPDLGALASSLEIHVGTLARSKLRFCSQERLMQIAETAISLQGLKRTKVMAYLVGTSDDLGELTALLDMRACTSEDCTAFGPEVDPIQRKCPDCLREGRRSVGIQEWIAEVEARISAAPASLREAWAAAKESSLTGAQMARIMNVSLESWRRIWAAAGLPPRPIQGRPRKPGLVDIRSYVPPNLQFSRRRTRRPPVVAPEQGAFDFGGRVAA